MKIFDKLTSFDRDNSRIGDGIRLRLILIYLFGGTVALIANLILGPRGLDFTSGQLRAALFSFSMSIVFCVLMDIFIIKRCFDPVYTYLKSNTAAKDASGREIERKAFTRAINLPALSVLRVEFIHIPIGVFFVFAPLLICNYLGIIEFSAMQFVLIIILGLMNTDFH